MSLSNHTLPLQKGIHLESVRAGQVVDIIEALAQQVAPDATVYVHPLGLYVTVGFARSPAGRQWEDRQALASQLRAHSFSVKGTGYAHSLLVDLPFTFL